MTKLKMLRRASVAVATASAALLALTERALDKAIDCNNLLFKRVSPSHSSYWPTVNAYREATDELFRAVNAVKAVTANAPAKGDGA